MSIVNQVIKILDEELQDVLGKKSLKRKELMGALRGYAKDEELVDEEDGRYVYLDDTLAELLKECGVKAKSGQRIMFGKLLKLTGKDAKEAGLVDY